MIGQIALRRAGSADEAFLRELYVDSHPELARLPLPVAAADDLIRMQIGAQRTQYLARYPAATDQVIELDAVAVGRCWTSGSTSELRLLDIAVLSSHRRRGVGRSVLTGLQRQAAEAGVALRLSVWHANRAARRLYDELGFVVDREADGYVSMSKTR